MPNIVCAIEFVPGCTITREWLFVNLLVRAGADTRRMPLARKGIDPSCRIYHISQIREYPPIPSDLGVQLAR
jgi:hypothetical protein